ncbi:MAG: hypothetical protein P8186_31930 [Anaerolineae bacterium]|jgi:hypothetical protein
MARYTRLAIAGVVLSLVLACRLGAGPSPAQVDFEATVDAQVSATLAVAATQAVEEIRGAQPPQALPLAVTVPTSTLMAPPGDTPVATTSPQASSGSTSAPPMPVIAYFNCEPCVVEPGGSATLSWDLSGATAAYLDGKGITAPSSTVVYPDQTTTYRLSAVNDNGRSEKTLTVEVRGLPTIHYFTCLPCEVTKGEQSTLSWDLSGATAAYLDGEGVPAPGSVVVAPQQTTTYRLVAVSERGSVERLVTVTVEEGGDPETVSKALRQFGYDVRSVGYLPLAVKGNTISVIMAAMTRNLQSQETADQYFRGLKTLYDNYPDQILSVGLYDGVRYVTFVSVEPPAFEAFLGGEMDGQVFWQVARWNVWDQWTRRWLTGEAKDFIGRDFGAKRFGF